MLRVPGPLDASLSWAVHCDDLADLPAPGTITGVQMFVNDTEFWEILWAIIGEVSDIQVDRETHAVIGATVNAALNFVTPIAATDTIGSITLPSTTVWWPTPT